MIKKLFLFFVYSNLFIACCALGLTYESFLLLHLPSSLNWYLLLIFLCTVFVYSLHYYIRLEPTKTDDRSQWQKKNKKILFAITVLSLFFIIGGIVYHFNSIFGKPGHFNYRNLAWFIIVPVIAFGYSYPFIPWNKKSLREVGLLKMAVLSFVWSFTTVVLPVIMLSDDADFYTRTFFMPVLFMQRFVFIAALCFLFNIKDQEEDMKEGIKTLAVIIGPKKSLLIGKWTMTILTALFTFFMLWAFELQDAIFYIAAFIPVILLFLLYQYFPSTKTRAGFIIRNDGLMLVQALLLIFALLFFI